MNAPLVKIAALLRRGRLDLASDNASPCSVERRRNARTPESKDAYIAEVDGALRARKMQIALDIHADDYDRQQRVWRNDRERYELARAARNGLEAA